MILIKDLSSYFTSLYAVGLASECYAAKLRSLGMHNKDDPYVDAQRLECDVSDWPSLEFESILLLT